MSQPSTVTVRYWAGARAAAGTEADQVSARDLDELRERLAHLHPGLVPVLGVASVLIEGRAHSGNAPLSEGQLVEVLPPFAGG